MIQIQKILINLLQDKSLIVNEIKTHFPREKADHENESLPQVVSNIFSKLDWLIEIISDFPYNFEEIHLFLFYNQNKLNNYKKKYIEQNLINYQKLNLSQQIRNKYNIFFHIVYTFPSIGKMSLNYSLDKIKEIKEKITQMENDRKKEINELREKFEEERKKEINELSEKFEEERKKFEEERKKEINELSEKFEEERKKEINELSEKFEEERKITNINIQNLKKQVDELKKSIGNKDSNPIKNEVKTAKMNISECVTKRNIYDMIYNNIKIKKEQNKELEEYENAYLQLFLLCQSEANINNYNDFNGLSLLKYGHNST